MKNKIIIILLFLSVILTILLFRKNDSHIKSFSDNDVKTKIESIFSDNKIQKINDRALIITHNKNYSIMVVDDTYLFIDYSTNPPTIHHYESIKPKIEVVITKISKEGFTVRHDDHEHFIKGNVPENKKVGDKIFIKDPHTYLYDKKSNTE